LLKSLSRKLSGALLGTDTGSETPSTPKESIVRTLSRKLTLKGLWSRPLEKAYFIQGDNPNEWTLVTPVQSTYIRKLENNDLSLFVGALGPFASFQENNGSRVVMQIRRGKDANGSIILHQNIYTGVCRMIKSVDELEQEGGRVHGGASRFNTVDVIADIFGRTSR
jgi:hypothetical protein